MMDKEITADMYRQFKAIKASAMLKFEARHFPNLVKRYKECNMYQGQETVEDLAKLLTSPQGSEFCLKYNFPDANTLRKFKGENVERYGIYIDAGEIFLKNPVQSPMVFAGNTNVTIDIDNNDKSYEVILMAGANGRVNASKWSVVSVKTGEGCSCLKNATDNAVIL